MWKWIVSRINRSIAMWVLPSEPSIWKWTLKLRIVRHWETLVDWNKHMYSMCRIHIQISSWVCNMSIVSRWQCFHICQCGVYSAHAKLYVWVLLWGLALRTLPKQSHNANKSSNLLSKLLFLSTQVSKTSSDVWRRVYAMQSRGLFIKCRRVMHSFSKRNVC